MSTGNKWVTNRTKTIVGERQKYNLSCWGQDRNPNGICIIINERTSTDVVEIYKKNQRIIRMKVVYDKEILNVISVSYAPQVEIEESVKRKF